MLLKNRPLTDLRFFLDLRRNHYPPYYSIPGIHEQESDDGEALDHRVVVLGLRSDVSVEKTVTPPTPSTSQPQGDAQVETTNVEIQRPGNTAEDTASEAPEQMIADAPEQDVIYSDDENSGDRVSANMP